MQMIRRIRKITLINWLLQSALLLLAILKPQMTRATGRGREHFRGYFIIFIDIQFTLRVLLLAVALVDVWELLKGTLASHLPIKDHGVIQQGQQG